MAYEVPLCKPPVGAASADLSTHQFKFVKTGASGVALATAGTDIVIGVLQNKPTLGQACEVECLGVSKVFAGNTVTAGQAVMCDATSRAIPATATNIGVAVALSGGAVGELITVLLRPSGVL